MGIENLSRHYSRTRSISRRRARLAALCALLPGMGAVYNRQYVKTVVHFVTIMGLFKLAAVHILGGVFLVAGFVFYAYSMVDAYRTAQLIAEGESAAADEARFKRSLARRAPVIGSIMIVAGIIYVLQVLHPFGISIARLLPVGLIILGGYLLVSYFKRSDPQNYESYNPKRLPFALIQGRSTGDRKQASRPGEPR